MMEWLASPTSWIILLLVANLALTFVLGSILMKGQGQMVQQIAEAVLSEADPEYLPELHPNQGLKGRLPRYNLPRRIAEAVAKRLATQAE